MYCNPSYSYSEPYGGNTTGLIVNNESSNEILSDIII